MPRGVYYRTEELIKKLRIRGKELASSGGKAVSSSGGKAVWKKIHNGEVSPPSKGNKGKHRHIIGERKKRRRSGEHTGRKWTEEQKQRQSESWKIRWMVMSHEDKKKHLLIRLSRPQQELFVLLKTKFADAELEYPIETNHRTRYADIGVPSEKFDFEYDGVEWHRNKESDTKRDLELAEVGWTVFRVNSEILKKVKIEKSIQQIIKED